MLASRFVCSDNVSYFGVYCKYENSWKLFLQDRVVSSSLNCLVVVLVSPEDGDRRRKSILGQVKHIWFCFPVFLKFQSQSITWT